MPKRITLPFSDELCQPLPRRERRGADDTPVADPAWEEERRRRVRLLLDHYGIDPNTMDGQAQLVRLAQLGLCLAFDLVPGLQEAGQRGAPRKTWTADGMKALRHLLEAVEQKKAKNPHMNDRSACQAVAREWKSHPPDHLFAGKNAEFLRRQLVDARRLREAEQYQKALAAALGGAGNPFELAFRTSDEVRRIANMLGDAPS